MKKCLALAAGILLLLLGHHARANVFNMGPELTNLDTVYVGDAGNAPDPTTGYGEVDYNYAIGKYDVTEAQYVDFLNAKATVATGEYLDGLEFEGYRDKYQLWNPNMITGCGITQSAGGTPEAVTLSYSVTSDWANRPVNWVDLWDACRFSNWLCNGQGNGDTETGAYTLNGYSGSGQIPRNAGASWFIPSLNEWYKAAYYKGGSANAGYWLYPTQSDTAPGNQLPDPGNSANYYNTGYTVGSPYYTTPVGAFSNSPGPYGTFDQGGNVRQWTDTVIKTDGDGTVVNAVSGGSFAGPWWQMMANASAGPDVYDGSDTGFRVAQAVPEPPSLLALFSAIPLLAFRELRKRKGMTSRLHRIDESLHTTPILSLVLLLAITSVAMVIISPQAHALDFSIQSVSTYAGNVPMYEMWSVNFQLSGLTYDLDNTGTTGINPFRTDTYPELYQAIDSSLWATSAGRDVWAQITDSSGTAHLFAVPRTTSTFSASWVCATRIASGNSSRVKRWLMRGWTST
jgi:formylglycine-generating enzyme required for sulfatase activity